VPRVAFPRDDEEDRLLDAPAHVRSR
jgi:hypothetical protein